LYKNYLNSKTVPATVIALITIIILSCNHFPVISNTTEPSAPPLKEEYVQDEVIVKFKQGVTENRIREINDLLGCEIIRSIGRTNTFLIKIKTGQTVKETINKYKLFDEVEYAEPNYIKRIDE
jgi:hypothetical protein